MCNTTDCAAAFVTGTVTFNVGGVRHEVSRDLIEAFPDCDLAELMIDHDRNIDSESEIFIDRDGSLFPYILDFMRCGRVSLPPSKSKFAFLSELKSFGFQLSNGDATYIFSPKIPRTIKFNVGGICYEISTYLLEEYPDCLLATRSSWNWEKDTDESEIKDVIFIDRNGLRFQYVLDFMRDGKVSLPPSESKDAVLSELQYFGFEVTEDLVQDPKIKQHAALLQAIDGIREEVNASELEYKSLRFAWYCAKRYMRTVFDLSDSCSAVAFQIPHKKDHDYDPLFSWSSSKNRKEVEGKVNSHLSRFGLSAKLRGWTSNGTADVEVNKIE